MNAFNRRTRLASLGLLAVIALAACSNTTNASTGKNEAFASASKAALAAPAPSVQPSSTTKPVNGAQYASAQPAKPQRAPMPADGQEYQDDLAEMTRAIQTGQPGRYVGLPTGFTTTGYPVFPATCTFYDDHSECETANGEVVDEAYLANKTVVVRNTDVLNTAAHTCGTQICVDNDGNVIGHVSKQMIAWRKANCTWDPYGTAKCKQ